MDDAKKELESISGQAEQLVKDALAEVLKAAQSGVLNKAVNLVQVVLPSAIVLKIGPLSFAVDNVNERIDVLQKWAKNPPSGVDGIKEMILEFAPSSVSIDLSISLAFLVVQSDSLEAGFSMTWDVEDFIYRLEDIINEIT